MSPQLGLSMPGRWRGRPVGWGSVTPAGDASDAITVAPDVPPTDVGDAPPVPSGNGAGTPAEGTPRPRPGRTKASSRPARPTGARQAKKMTSKQRNELTHSNGSKDIGPGGNGTVLPSVVDPLLAATAAGGTSSEVESGNGSAPIEVG